MVFPDFKSRVNQPDRLFLNSSDDVTNVRNARFDRFEIRLATPILDAKRAQLLRATIPNALVNIPDYALCFWYYRLPVSGGFSQPRTLSQLACVRILPSWFANGSGYLSGMPVNSYYATPQDLVNALNLSANNDSTTFNSFYQQGDVAFAYNSVTKKISVTGTNTNYIYDMAGYGSPIVQSASPITVPTYLYGNSGITTTIVQPQIAQYNLNLRCGYAQPNDFTTGGQPWTQVGGTSILFDSFPNLIYTQCYYLYASIVAGSSLGSNNTHNLLSVVPCSSAQLGVTNYTALTLNWLTKVPDNIYSVIIEIRDDNNIPVYLPDNAQINIELALKYDG